MRQTVLTVLALFLVLPAWASDLGDPLDCSDWVFLEPGLSCTEWAGPNDTVAYDFRQPAPINNYVFDNTGAQLRYEFTNEDTFCGIGPRLDVLRYDGQNPPQVIAYLESRCDIQVGFGDRVINRVGNYAAFDPQNGRMFVWLTGECMTGNCTYTSRDWVAAIEGFATTFDILQTYEPTTSQLSFSVPAIPEGFQYADYFDTYYGTLATVGDWSQLQPLQCGYPATPPNVGDYLTVTDTLPTPSAGQGYYYVTAVTHQGQTRWGRQASGGVLSGRDPAGVAGCSE